jgi:hypothetical protein
MRQQEGGGTITPHPGTVTAGPRTGMREGRAQGHKNQSIRMPLKEVAC